MNFLYALSEIRNPVLDFFFQAVTYLGQEIPILIVICFLFWCLNKQLAYRIAISFFSSGLLLQNLKITCRIPRPWVLDPDFPPVPSAVPDATGYSFPSGHTQSASSFWGTLAVASKQKVFAALFTVLFLLVAFSRMYLGCHTPMDVCGGLVLGLFSVWFGGFLMKRLHNTRKENQLFSIIVILFSLFTAIYALTLSQNGTITANMAEDCVKAAGAGLGFGIGWYLERVHICFSTDLNRREKIRRFVIGLILVLILKLGLGLISQNFLLLKMAEYGLLVLFIIAGYPALFTKGKF